MTGQSISFSVNGKPAEGYLALPSDSNAPGIIVLHAWWGLNPFFKSVCDRLAAEGFVVFAPDLNEGRIAATVDEAKELLDKFESESALERRQAIVTAAPDYLRGRPEVREGPFALMGFSMGAAWSLVLASERAEDIGKVVLFYGAYSVDFSKFRAEVLGHFSDTDEWEPMDGIRAMESDMRNAGLQPSFHIYPQIKHWFFEDDRPEFDPQAAEVAWKRTLDFLRS